MRIWHFATAASPHNVDGVNNSLWAIAIHQAFLGHDVHIVLPSDAGPPQPPLFPNLHAHCVNASRLFFSTTGLDHLLQSYPPEIVHIHSLFSPRQSTLQRYLYRCGIPYVVSPHGCLAPSVLKRGRIRKYLYCAMIERPNLRRAAALAAALPGEAAEIRRFVGHYSGTLRSIGNPVDIPPSEFHWFYQLNTRPRLTFLGRLDVCCKGLDILADIARYLPDAVFNIHGTVDPGREAQLDALQESAPGNFHIHPPVFHQEKYRLLSESSLYIQTSRWEAFGISLVEAMLLGVPCAISSTLHMAEFFHRHHLGVVLPNDPVLAAELLADLLRDRPRLEAYSVRAQHFARQHFDPPHIAASFVALYEDALSVYCRQNPSPVEPVAT